MLDLSFHSPYRLTDWRWRRACHIIEGGPRATARLDGDAGAKWIRRAVKFRKMLDKCDAKSHYRLAEFDPVMFWAYTMFDRPERRLRWTIEARILARQTDKEIADEVASSPETIEAYEAVFFNVRDRLDRKEYILHVVLSEAGQNCRASAYDVVWKLFAYCGGPLVLERLLEPVARAVPPKNPDEVPAALGNAAGDNLKKNAAIAAVVLPVNSRTAPVLVHTLVRLTKLERNLGTDSQANEQLLANINAMLGSMPFGVGTREEDRCGGLLGQFDERGIELHSDEMMLAAAGIDFPGQDTLLTLAFPDHAS
jgi:hypothetical protein